MKRFLLMVLSLLLVVSSTVPAFAGGFNFAPGIDFCENEILIYVEDNEILQKSPSLSIDYTRCGDSFEPSGAGQVIGSTENNPGCVQAMSYSVKGDMVSLTISHGGLYVIYNDVSEYNDQVLEEPYSVDTLSEEEVMGLRDQDLPVYLTTIDEVDYYLGVVNGEGNVTFSGGMDPLWHKDSYFEPVVCSYGIGILTFDELEGYSLVSENVYESLRKRFALGISVSKDESSVGEPEVYYGSGLFDESCDYCLGKTLVILDESFNGTFVISVNAVPNEGPETEYSCTLVMRWAPTEVEETDLENCRTMEEVNAAIEAMIDDLALQAEEGTLEYEWNEIVLPETTLSGTMVLDVPAELENKQLFNIVGNNTTINGGLMINGANCVYNVEGIEFVGAGKDVEMVDDTTPNYAIYGDMTACPFDCTFTGYYKAVCASPTIVFNQDNRYIDNHIGLYIEGKSWGASSFELCWNDFRKNDYGIWLEDMPLQSGDGEFYDFWRFDFSRIIFIDNIVDIYNNLGHSIVASGAYFSHGGENYCVFDCSSYTDGELAPVMAWPLAGDRDFETEIYPAYSLCYYNDGDTFMLSRCYFPASQFGVNCVPSSVLTDGMIIDLVVDKDHSDEKLATWRF